MGNALTQAFLQANPQIKDDEDNVTYDLGIRNEHRIDEIEEKYPGFKSDYKRVLNKFDPISFTERASDAVKSVGAGTLNTIAEIPEAAGILGDIAFGDVTDDKGNLFTDIAQGIRDKAPELSEDIRLRESIVNRKIPEALGSAAGFISGTGAIRVGAKAVLAGAGRLGKKKVSEAGIKFLASKSGVAVSTAAIGAVINAPQGFRDAMAHGAEPDQAIESFFLNALAGTSEAVGVGRVGGRLFTRLDKISNGEVKKTLLGKIKKGGVEAIEEAIQEVVQGVASDIIAKDIAAYDPDRVLFEDIIEEATVGGATGFMVSFIVESLNRKADLKLDDEEVKEKRKEFIPDLEKEDKVQETGTVSRLTAELKMREAGVPEGWVEQFLDEVSTDEGSIVPANALDSYLSSFSADTSLTDLEDSAYQGMAKVYKERRDRQARDRIAAEMGKSKALTVASPVNEEVPDGWDVGGFSGFDENATYSESGQNITIHASEPHTIQEEGVAPINETVDWPSGGGATIHIIGADPIEEVEGGPTVSDEFYSEKAEDVRQTFRPRKPNTRGLLLDSPELRRQQANEAAINKSRRAFLNPQEDGPFDEAARATVKRLKDQALANEFEDQWQSAPVIAATPAPKSAPVIADTPALKSAPVEAETRAHDLLLQSEGSSGLGVFTGMAGEIEEHNKTDIDRKMAKAGESGGAIDKFDSNLSKIESPHEMLDTTFKSIGSNGKIDSVSVEEHMEKWRDRDEESLTKHDRQTPSYITMSNDVFDFLPAVQQVKEALSAGNWTEAINLAGKFGAKSDPPEKSGMMGLFKNTVTGQYHLTNIGKKMHNSSGTRIPVVHIPKSRRDEFGGIIERTPKRKTEVNNEWLTAELAQKETPLEMIGIIRLKAPVTHEMLDFKDKLDYFFKFEANAVSAAAEQLQGRQDERSFVRLDAAVGEGDSSVADFIGIDELDSSATTQLTAGSFTGLQGSLPEDTVDINAVPQIEGSDLYATIDGDTDEVSVFAKAELRGTTLSIRGALEAVKEANATTLKARADVLEVYLRGQEGIFLMMKIPEVREKMEGVGLDFDALGDVIREHAPPAAKAISRVILEAQKAHPTQTREEGIVELESQLTIADMFESNFDFRNATAKQVTEHAKSVRERIVKRNRAVSFEANTQAKKNSDITKRFYDAVTALRLRGINVKVLERAIREAVFIEGRNERFVRIAMSDIESPSMESFMDLIHEAGHSVLSLMPAKEKALIIKSIQHASNNEFGIDNDYTPIIDKELSGLDLQAETQEDKLVEAAARLSGILSSESVLKRRGFIAEVVRAVKEAYLSALNVIHKAVTGHDDPKAVAKWFAMRVEAELSGGTMSSFSTFAAGPIKTIFSRFRAFNSTAYSPIAFNGKKIKTPYVPETSIEAMKANDENDLGEWDPNNIKRYRNTGIGEPIRDYDFESIAVARMAQFRHIHETVLIPFYKEAVGAIPTSKKEFNQNMAMITGIPIPKLPHNLMEEVVKSYPIKNKDGSLTRVGHALQSDNPLGLIKTKEQRQRADLTRNEYAEIIQRHIMTNGELNKTRLTSIEGNVEQLEEEISEIKLGRLEEISTYMRAIRRTADHYLNHFKKGRGDKKRLSGFTKGTLERTYLDIMGESKIPEMFYPALNQQMKKLKTEDFAGVLNEIGSILSNNNLFDGRRTDWELVHDIVLEKSSRIKDLKPMQNPVYASFIYTSLSRRKDIVAALEMRRGGKLDLKKFSNLISLQFSNKPEDMETVAKFLEESGELGVKLGKVLSNIARKESQLRKYKKAREVYRAAAAAMEKLDIINKEKHSTDALIGRRAMVTKKKGTFYTGNNLSTWSFSPGQSVIFPKSPDTPHEQVGLPEHLIEADKLLNLDREGRINEVLVAQAQWLNANKHSESAVKELIEMQRDQIMAYLWAQQQADNARNWMQSFIGSIRDKMDNIPHPIAKSMVNMINRYSVLAGQYGNMKVGKRYGTPWVKAVRSASKALGMENNIPSFYREVYTPLVWWMRARTDLLADISVEDAIKIALRNAPVDGIDIPKAKEALRVLAEATGSATGHAAKVTKEMGIKVHDSITIYENGKKKEVKIERDHFGDPRQKTPVTLSKSISSVVDSIKEKLGLREVFNIKELEQVLSDPESKEFEDALNKINDTIGTGRAYTDFIMPLLSTELKNVLVEDQYVSTEHADIGREAALKSESLGEAMAHITENMDPIEAREYMSQVFLRIVRTYRKIEKIVNEHQISDEAIVVTHNNIRHFGMDASSLVDLPHQFLEFATYQPDQIVTNYRMLAVHASFGRDMSSWSRKMKTVQTNLSQLSQDMQKMIESGMEEKDIKAAMVKEYGQAEGSRRFELMKNSRVWGNDARTVENEWDQYIKELGGTPPEMKLSNEFVGNIAGATLQSLGSIITELSSITVEPVARYGLLGGMKFAAKSSANLAARVFDSYAHAIVGETLFYDKLYDDYNRIGRGDDSTNASFMENLALSQMDASITEERSGKVKLAKRFTRGASTFLRSGFNRQDGRVDSIQPHAPYSQFSNGMFFAITATNWTKFENIMLDVVKLVEGKSEAEIMSMKLTPEKLAEVNPKWNGLLGGKKESNAILDLAFKYDIHLPYEAMKYLHRKRIDPKTDVLTDGVRASIAQMTPNDFTLDGNITNRSPKFLNTATGRIISPLFSWPYSQFAKILGYGTPTSSDKKDIAKAVFSASWIVMSGMPIALALSYLRDWYEEDALGKRSARPDVLKSDKPFHAMMERVSRVGNLGIGGDMVNRWLNPDPSVGVMDLGKSVFVFSMLNNMSRSISDILNSDWNLTYSSFWRGTIQQFGGGGYLQMLQMANKALGLDNAESRATNRLHVNNLIRLGGKENQLEIRPFASGLSAPTPYKAYVKDMVDAALYGDFEVFKYARKKAEEAAREAGFANPQQVIKDSFTSRHPLKAAFKRAITQQEFAQLLKSMDPGQADAVVDAINEFNKFSVLLGASPYTGTSATKSKPSRSFILGL
jgi:hypothetical protein